MGNFSLAMEDVFGTMAEGQAANMRALLQEYASTTFSGRDEVKKRIAEAAGGQLSEKATDLALFDLGSEATGLDQAVASLVDGTRQALTSTIERIRNAKANGGEVAAADTAFSQAFSEQGDVLRDIIDGTSGLDATQTEEKLREFFARYRDLINDQPALEAEKRVTLMNSLRTELASALEQSDNSAEISATVSQIGTSIEFLSLSVQDRVKAILDSIALSTATVDTKIAKLKQEQSDLPTGLDRWVLPRPAKAAADAKSAELQLQIDQLEARKVAMRSEEERVREMERTKLAQQAAGNAKVKEGSATTAADLVSRFNNDQEISAALSNPQALKNSGLRADQVKYLTDNRDAILGASPDLLGRLGSTQTDAEGNVKASPELAKLESIFGVLAGGLAKVTEAEKRRVRDEANALPLGALDTQTRAQAEIKIASHRKDYAAIGPLIDKEFDAQRAILEKQLAQAEAKVEDRKGNPSKDGQAEVAEKNKVTQIKAQLSTLDVEKEEKKSQYAAKAKSAGEVAKRKADTDAAKQAKIAVTQTGIEQRIIKQDFEEAIKTGNIEQFLAKSKEYEQVQEKLRGQLSEELKARGYTASQILDEIKLREDLNKPLAEQVENIRKLADQRIRLVEISNRKLGVGT